MDRLAILRTLLRPAGGGHGLRPLLLAAALAAFPVGGLAQARPAAPAIEWSASAIPLATQPLGLRIDATRWSATTGGQGRLGLSLGMAGSADRPWAVPQWGVHWRAAISPRTQLTLSGWAPLPNQEPASGASGPQPPWQQFDARVELQWQGAGLHGLVPEYGAIGVQFQTGSRLMLRARHGGPFFYYRARF